MTDSGAKPLEPTSVLHRLATAPADKLMAVIAVLDMAAGGVADSLLDHVRPRLAQLRPPRPLRFTRLLFMPLNPVIIDARHWIPGGSMIPRTSLVPLARTVRAAMGTAVHPIDAAIADRTTRDAEVVERVGGMLWPQAAAILSDAPTPVGWIEAGLKLDIYAPFARAIGAVLARLPQLQALERQVERGISLLQNRELEAILDGIMAESADVQGMMITLLLGRVPQAGPAMRRRASARNATSAALRAAEEQATAVLFDHLEGNGAPEVQVLGYALTEAAPEVRRIAMLLDGLEAPGAATPERRKRLAALRHRLDLATRARFVDGLENEFLAPLQKPNTGAGAVQQSALEATARRLRALEVEGRRIGGGESYDALLREAAAMVSASGPHHRGLVHKVRLVEILAGPEAALALLKTG